MLTVTGWLRIMLEISNQAFSGLKDQTEQRFVAKLAAFLREKVPALASESLEATIVQCKLLKRKANSFDMSSERAVAAFAMTAAVLGLDFVERFRGARQILYADAPEEEKAELLEGFTVTLLDRLGR